jgi:uroporphyrinogen decarboxylase
MQAQIDAGAQALQLFDSWAGHLTPAEYAEWGLPYTQRIFQALGNRVPLILFCQKAGHLLPLMGRSGAQVLSVGEDISLVEARRQVPKGCALQGNLSPELLRAGPVNAIRAATRAMLQEGGTTGFIANLGHGVLKETPPDHVAAFVEAVRLV